MRVQAATICIQVPRFTRLRELRDALRRWLVDGERGAATSSSSADASARERPAGRQCSNFLGVVCSWGVLGV